MENKGVLDGEEGRAKFLAQVLAVPYNLLKQGINQAVQGGGGGAVDSVNGQTGAVVLDASDVGAYTTGEVDTALGLKADQATTYTKTDVDQHLKNIAPVTTFMTSGAISQVITAGQSVDIFDVFASSFTESPKICTGALPLDVSANAFSQFLDVSNGKIIFPDVETTTGGQIDVREVSVSCRVSGTFSGNGDATVLVEYWELDVSGAIQTLIGAMSFERQFQQDFDARASSLVSRLSKDNSTLVQNGAKFIITLPASATEDFTLTQIDFLINIGS